MDSGEELCRHRQAKKYASIPSVQIFFSFSENTGIQYWHGVTSPTNSSSPALRIFSPPRPHLSCISPLPCKCFWINQRAFPLCLEECWARGVSDTKNYQTWPLSLRGKRLDGTGKQTIRDPPGGTLSGAGDKGNRITFIRPSAYSSVLPFISLDNKSWLSLHCAQDGSMGGFKDTEGNVISSFVAPRNLGETNSYGANRQYGTGGLTWVSGREYLPGSRTEPHPTGAPSRRGPHRSPRPTRGWEAQDLTWPSNAWPRCALDRSWAQAEGLAPAVRCSVCLSVSHTPPPLAGTVEESLGQVWQETGGELVGTLGLELLPDELPSSRFIPEPPSLPFNALLSIQIVHKAQVSHSEPASLCIPLSAPSSRSRKQAACRPGSCALTPGPRRPSLSGWARMWSSEG